MKFSCDNCGAQYLIADDKLGQRGVKVRCKKCSFVIVLKPGGPLGAMVSAASAAPLSDASAASLTPLSDASAPPSKGPRGGLEARPRAIGGEASLPPEATSSEFGLSQEFRAMGFDEGPASDDADAEPPTPQREAAGLGLSTPPRIDEHQAATSVTDEREGGFGLHEGFGAQDDEATVAAMPGEDLERAVGKGLLESTHVGPAQTPFDQEATGAIPVRPREAADAEASAASRESADDPGGLGASLARWSGDESAEAPRTEVGPSQLLRTAKAPSSGGGSGSLAALAARESEDDGPGEEAAIADAIGSAFDAMFGGLGDEAAPGLFGQRPENGGADVHQVSTREFPAELHAELAMAGSADRLETRVFDTEAMAQVQAEQDRAQRVTAKPAPVKEWYVAIDEQQVGPLTVDEVKERWDARQVGPATLAWRAGMADWLAIRFAPGLEGLGPMVERSVEKAPAAAKKDAAPERASVPPHIAPPAEPERAPVSPRGAPSVAEVEDGGWRPSAASALAALAAEELSEPAAPRKEKPKSDVALAGALPATSGALEKLLEGEAKPAATLFGAAEKSESFVRPLPRSVEAVTSVPLLKAPEKSKSNLLVPVSIVVGAVLLGGIVVGGMMMTSKSPPAREAPASAPLAVAAPSPPPAAPPPAADPGAAAAPAAEPSREASAPAPRDVEPVTGRPAEPARPVPAAAVEPRKPAPEPRKPIEAREAREPVARPEPEPPARAAPEPPVRPAPERPAPAPQEVKRPVEEEDLLGASKKKKVEPEPEPEAALPRQLDDADILGVIRDHRGDVRGCLDKQEASGSSLDGTMTVKMVIQKDGTPSRITVTPDEFKASVVGKCVVTAVARWRFPAFSGPTMPVDFPVRVKGN
jgi:predicted Zn finger-like uncharacterized protein